MRRLSRRWPEPGCTNENECTAECTRQRVSEYLSCPFLFEVEVISWIQRWAPLVLLVALTAPSITLAAEPATSRIGEELQVFPGDKFYVEGERIDVPILELADTFESRMPGAMRIRFSFAIDARKLRWVRDRYGWSYFAAPTGKARAWHGLVGNVLAEGDTVGVRINKKDGTREWFVDNSIHNATTTIWSREVDPEKDVEITVDGTEQVFLKGHRIRGLEYFGIRDQQLRIRYTEIDDSLQEEEFLFPISEQMPMLIGVMGLRAEVREINGASARIKILRGFEGDGFADPTP
jgi:hypothetical protein